MYNIVKLSDLKENLIKINLSNPNSLKYVGKIGTVRLFIMNESFFLILDCRISMSVPFLGTIKYDYGVNYMLTDKYCYFNHIVCIVLNTLILSRCVIICWLVISVVDSHFFLKHY